MLKAAYPQLPLSVGIGNSADLLESPTLGERIDDRAVRGRHSFLSVYLTFFGP